MSIRIIDLFVQMRNSLQSNRELLLKMEVLENKIGNQDHKMSEFEKDLQSIIQCVREILSPEPVDREKIGYKINDKNQGDGRSDQ